MPDARQLTVELPLEVLSEAGFPVALLRVARFLRFLRQDLYGFQISCKVPTAEISAFKNKWEQYESVVSVNKLYRTNKDGLETLLIRGRWLRKGSVNSRDQAARFLRSLSNCQKYLLRPPVVVGKKLRVAMEREQSRIGQLIAKFDKQKVPYRIAEPAEHTPKADFMLHLAT
jgi:hypothetical protein